VAEAVPQLKRLDADFPSRRLLYASRQHVGFVMDKVALEQVFSEYFGCRANDSTNFSIIIIIWGWHNRPIGGRSAEWTQLDSTSPIIPIKKNDFYLWLADYRKSFRLDVKPLEIQDRKFL
jgi:hypothetical protein